MLSRLKIPVKNIENATMNEFERRKQFLESQAETKEKIVPEIMSLLSKHDLTMVTIESIFSSVKHAFAHFALLKTEDSETTHDTKPSSG